MEATAWIALIALGFTGVQAWVAHRKLRFDLFEKRFETWNSFEEAANAHRRDIDEGTHPGNDRYPTKYLYELSKIQKSIELLFPEDVHEAAEELLINLSRYHVAKRGSDRPGNEEEDQDDLRKNLMNSSDNLRKAHNDLAKEAHRYIRQYGLLEQFGVYLRKRIALWRISRNDVG